MRRHSIETLAPSLAMMTSSPEWEPAESSKLGGNDALKELWFASSGSFWLKSTSSKTKAAGIITLTTKVNKQQYGFMENGRKYCLVWRIQKLLYYNKSAGGNLLLGIKVFQKSGRSKYILKSSGLKDASEDQPKRKPDIKFNQQRFIMGWNYVLEMKRCKRY